MLSYVQLEKLQINVIDPFLKLHHLPRYHSNPEFHASFAWSLLVASNNETPFTPALLKTINAELSGKLGLAMPKNGWQFDGLKMKVAKTVKHFPFQR